MFRLLVLERDESQLKQVTEALGAGGRMHFQVHGEPALDAGLQSLRRGSFDCVILSTNLDRGWDTALEHCARTAADTPVVILAAPDEAGFGPKAIKAGAQDFVVRQPRVYAALNRIVLFAIERAAFQREHRRSSETIEDQRLLVDGLMQLVSEAVLVTNAEGRIERANHAAAQLLDRTAHDLEGKRLLELIAPEGRQRFARFEAASGVGEEAMSDSFRMGLESGELVVELYGLPLKPRGEVRQRLFVLRELEADFVAETGVPGEPAAAREPRGSADLHSVGLFQMVGLGRLREVAGARWAELENRVHRLVEHVLDNHLESKDRFWRNHDGDYLVLFRHGDLKRASRQCEAILKRIEQAVLGNIEEAGKGAAAGLSPEQRQGLGEVDMSVHNVPVEAGDEADGEAGQAEANEAGLADEISQRLETMRVKDRAEANRLLHELYIGCKADYAMVQGADGQPSRLHVLKVDEASRERMAVLRERGREDRETAFELDAFTLSTHAELLDAEPGAEDMIALVDVSYLTLTTKAYRDRYLDLCAKLPHSLRRSILFNLHDVAAGTYLPKLNRVLGAIASYSRDRAIHFRELRTDIIDLRVAPIRFVVIHFDDLKRQIEGDTARVKAFVEQVHRAQTRILVRGVPRQLAAGLRDRLKIDLTTSA